MRSSCLGFGDQRVGEDAGVAGRAGRGALTCSPVTTLNLETPWYLSGRCLGRGVAVPLLGDDVDQDGAGVFGVPHIAQHRQQVVQVMAVDRADIVEAEFFEQRAAGEHAADVFLGALGGAFQAPGEFLGHAAGDFAQGQEALAADDARQIGAHGADRGGDRHFVVVQHDDEAGPAGASIVHGFVGHAGAHRAIADDRDHVTVGMAVQLVGDREAEPGRDAGGAVGGAERVVFAFAAAGEAGQSALPGAGCARGPAARSGSCGGRPGGRRPRSPCPPACRTPRARRR